MHYTLQQHSIWNAFQFDVLDFEGVHVGQIRVPTWFQMKNAHLRVHPLGATDGNIKLELHGQSYEICVEILRRASAPDLRYTLEQESEVLATIDLLAGHGLNRTKAYPRAPWNGRVESTGSFFRKQFELHGETGLITRIGEPHFWSWRRVLVIDFSEEHAVAPLLFAAYVIKELYW